MILAQLSQRKINDNWMNKPDASLQAIFRSWMPQTAASVDQRVKALEMIIRRFPDVGWEICIEQIKPGSRIGHYSYRPRWRSDASGAGQVVRQGDVRLQQKGSGSPDCLAIPRRKDPWRSRRGSPGDARRRSDQGLGPDRRMVPESQRGAKAALRERIRRFAFTRRGRHRKLGESTHDRAREAYESLQPDDPVIRHGWLFADQWVQESGEEIEEEDFDYQKREERIDRLRREAMLEIWTRVRFRGVKELLTGSSAAGTVGRYVASCIIGVKQRVDFIRRCLSLDEDLRSKAEWCLQGFLWAIDETRAPTLQAAAEGLPAEDLGGYLSALRSRHLLGVFWIVMAKTFAPGTGRTCSRPGAGTPPPSSPN